MSPAERDLLLLFCAKAGRRPARTPAPTAAAPANTPPFKKERRLTVLREGETISVEDGVTSGDARAEPRFSLLIMIISLFFDLLFSKLNSAMAAGIRFTVNAD